MDDDDLLILPIVLLGGFGGLMSLLALPWLAIPLVGFCGYKWYKKWRFRNLKKADKHNFWYFDFDDLTPYWHKGMLYIGNSEDGTIRYWYDEGKVIPQAVDNGQVYWDRYKRVDDSELRKKLDGFQEMGNEWPAYYHEIELAEKRKNKRKKEKNQTTAAMAFLDEHPDALLDLEQTVDQLRKEVEGYCPVLVVPQEENG